MGKKRERLLKFVTVCNKLFSSWRESEEGEESDDSN